MCILFISNEHPEYRLIALSNRDEVFNRATAPAAWHGQIFNPVDLSAHERGTWIALSKKARIAVLLNVQEQPIKKEPISRGIFALEYVIGSPDQTCENWYESIEKQADQSGGFNLICGDIATRKFNLVTNRGSKSHQRIEVGTHCFSNALLGQEWPKTTMGESLFKDIINRASASGMSEKALIDECFALLSKNSLEIQDTQHPTPKAFQKSIFIPPVGEKDSVLYGTRTQTIILVDNDGNVKYIEKDVLARDVKKHEFTIDLKQ